MGTIGRNAPCPCGSGKKYKKCCLVSQERPTAALRFGRAVNRAFDWLGTHHRHALRRAMEESLHAFDERLAEADEDERLPEHVLRTLSLVAGERVLAEIELQTPQGSSAALELLTGPGGPPLPLEEREVLDELASRPLRAYEVAAVDAGRGLELVDILTKERFEVEEHTGSRQLSAGDVLVTRILHRQQGATLSSVVLPFPRAELQSLREDLREIEPEQRKLPPRERRRQLGEWLVDAWLETMIRRSRPPEIMDAATGDRVVLTTDHYRVRDWEALSRVLAEEADVDGSREDGGWTRLERRDGDGDRILVSLNIGKGDRLEAFTRSLALADEGRAWLERVAGSCLAFKAREVVDPREVLKRGEPQPQVEEPELELPDGLHQTMHERIYANWATQPLPALDDKAPRQAVRSKLGRERVTELLLVYEHEERKRARKESRPPVDYDFLWRSVGLERPLR